MGRPMPSFSLQEKLGRVILGSKAAQQQPEEVKDLWQTCGDLMFSLEPRLRHLGLGKEVSPALQELGKVEASLRLLGMHGRAADDGRQETLPPTLNLKPLGTTENCMECF